MLKFTIICCKFDENVLYSQLLRRSAAEALLIQNLEFQTISCPSIRCPMFVREKKTKLPKPRASGEVADTTRIIFESIFKVPKKTAFARGRNDLPGPLKSRFFPKFEPFQLCLHTPSQNDKKLTPAVLERTCHRVPGNPCPAGPI